MTGSSFHPTNRLEAALQAAVEDPEAWPDFLAALADGPIIVAVRRAPGPDGRVDFPLMRHEERDHVVAFTSQTQLERAGHPDTPRIALDGRALAEIWPTGLPMALNPRGDLGLALPADTVTALGTAPPGSSARSFPTGTRLFVGDPATEPIELLERLSRAARELPGVLTMHRAQVAIGSGDAPFIVVGVQMDSPLAGPETELERLATRAQVDVALIALGDDQHEQDPAGRWMLERDAPFYRRRDGAG